MSGVTWLSPLHTREGHAPALLRCMLPCYHPSCRLVLHSRAGHACDLCIPLTATQVTPIWEQGGGVLGWTCGNNMACGEQGPCMAGQPHPSWPVGQPRPSGPVGQWAEAGRRLSQLAVDIGNTALHMHMSHVHVHVTFTCVYAYRQHGGLRPGRGHVLPGPSRRGRANPNP